MAILMTRVEPVTTRLIGEWISDNILYNLHTMDKSFTDGLSILIFYYGNHALVLPKHVDV